MSLDVEKSRWIGMVGDSLEPEIQANESKTLHPILGHSYGTLPITNLLTLTS